MQVKIWDTAGQERFRTLTHAFYKQANGMAVAFDVTNEVTFKNVREWVFSFNEHADPHICKVIVGIKKDNFVARKISTKEAEQFARQYQTKYAEVSLTDQTEVTALFEDLMTEIYNKRQAEGGPIRDTFTLQAARHVEQGQQAAPRAKKCC